MPTLSVSAVLNGTDKSKSEKGDASVGTITVNVLVHTEPFMDREDGQRVVEHAIKRWNEPVVQCYRSAPQEARCYIEVERDHYFAFEFAISNRSVVTSDGLKFAIFLDDHYVDYVFMVKGDCEHPQPVDKAKQPVAWKRGVARCGRSNAKRQWYEQSFYFRQVNFSAREVTDLGMAMRQRKRAAGIGNLRIEVYRLVRGARALDRKEVNENALEYDDRFLIENLPIRRDFLNERSATMSATLAGRMNSNAIDVGRTLHQIDGATKPIAIFHFEYRTRDVLKTLGYEHPIHAPLLSTQPTQSIMQRPSNTLTDEELIQRKAMYALGQKRKREPSPPPRGAAYPLRSRKRMRQAQPEPARNGQTVNHRGEGKAVGRSHGQHPPGQNRSLLHRLPSALNQMQIKREGTRSRASDHM